MNKKFFLDAEHIENNNYNEINSNLVTNDILVNNFLTKNISLESLIENEIFNKFNVT